MNGIVINIDPVLLRIGHFELRWYGVIIALAILAAVLVATREFRRKGLAADEVYALLPWVLIGGLVGARLFHVIDRWEYYAGTPLQIFAVQQGGLAIWGAIAGGGIALALYAKVRRLPLGRLVDAIAPGLIVAQMIGRFACIINGDAAGGITSLPWGFVYTHPGSMIPAALYGQPTHPYPVYEILWNGLSLLILLRLRHHFTGDGLVFLSYLSLYSLGRFVLTFVRQENIFWGLQQAQIVALLAFLGSLAAAVYFARVKRPTEEDNLGRQT